jgi:hypothetical protein
MPVIPGSIVGTARFRSIHRDFYKGIYVPKGQETAVSIRFRPNDNLGRGYADRWVSLGRVLDYTGQGGPPENQSWNRFNSGLRTACEEHSPVHVFEELRGGSPKTYRYWGQALVVRWYEQFDETQDRTMIRFVLEVPDQTDESEGAGGNRH